MQHWMGPEVQEELPPVGAEAGAVTVTVWVGPGRQPPRATKSAGMAAARRESVMAKQKVKMALEYMMLGGGGAAGEAAVVALAGVLELKNDTPRRRPYIRKP